ncbi:AraC family transcriptional regulator [Chitinophaga sp. Cy-1792]|uniref:AraC family transcriptional regulator n=1 Tax=Chitinophaga sp. Cy-1792 TaxID=2608339 RepID=UPI0014241504|nr:helix-turn-helix domain-containing protein [Chitinophaga sp. Cy-1792]NIG53785.1 AraC family transcriptional regulator [Chitinophaga sp. Cy-1792]
MSRKETINGFYDRHGQPFTEGGNFYIYRREDFACDITPLPSNRRDFYKISLMTSGEGTVGYADKTIYIDRPGIMFTNPWIPYSWEPSTTDQTGYFCVFTEDFVTPELRKGSLAESPLFKVGGHHLFYLEPNGVALVKQIFDNILRETASDYPNKNEVINNYVQLIMHEAMKVQPVQQYQSGNAAARISSLFMDLLDLQFPIASPQQTLQFKNANEFATQLNIHTNHLNRALREVTGKTTTEWIASRIMQEAKTLLQRSSWDISEIGYTLGFEHASNFNIFFKKHTSLTPNQFRKTIVAN